MAAGQSNKRHPLARKMQRLHARKIQQLRASADSVGGEEKETTTAAPERSRAYGSNVGSDLSATLADSSLLAHNIERPESVAKYQHTPLENASTQIRLLHFTSLPGSMSELDWHREGQISCTIEDYDLQDMRGKFNAISYTWGHQVRKLPILINSRTFWVSENLWKLLEAIMKGPLHAPSLSSAVYREFWTTEGSKVIAFWVDQICIDQTRVDERSHQVKLMSAIYMGAKLVIICLGGHERYPEHHDIRIKVLSQSEYWTRLWIIQEIMLARELLVLDRGHLVMWHEVRRQWIDRLRLPIPAIVQRKMIPGIMTNNFALHRVLELFSAQKCHDPRDKVYGLMGIVHEKERIEIDYNKKAPEIYWDAIAGLTPKKELQDPDRIIELGREMGVTGEEEISEGTIEKFGSLFGGRTPREVFHKGLDM